MPKYKIHFEYEDEIEAEDEETALIQSTNNIHEWIGNMASVEEIDEEKSNERAAAEEFVNSLFRRKE